MTTQEDYFRGIPTLGSFNKYCVANYTGIFPLGSKIGRIIMLGYIFQKARSTGFI